MEVILPPGEGIHETGMKRPGRQDRDDETGKIYFTAGRIIALKHSEIW